MNILTIIIKGREAGIPLYFNDYKSAIDMQKRILHPAPHLHDIHDHYGHSVTISHDQVGATVVTDWAQFLKAQTDCGVLQAKAAKDFQLKAGMNPTSVMMPGMPGPMRQP